MNIGKQAFVRKTENILRKVGEKWFSADKCTKNRHGK
jgi:hypothetical protein